MVDIRVCAVVYGIIYDYVRLIKCVLYIRKILLPILLLPHHLMHGGQKKAKAVIVYIPPDICISPRMKIVVLYYLPTSYQTYLC